MPRISGDSGSATRDRRFIPSARRFSLRGRTRRHRARSTILEDARRRDPRRFGDEFTDRYSAGLSILQHLQRRVGAATELDEVVWASASRRSSESQTRSTLPAREVKIEQALSELGHLREPSSDGDARDRVTFGVFQHAADEVAHVDERGLGKTVQLLHGRLGRRSGRACDVRDAARARHVDTAVDRVNPGRAGIGNDDPGRAQIESPPIIPRRPLSVLAASASPPGIEISTTTSPDARTAPSLRARPLASSHAAPD